MKHDMDEYDLEAWEESRNICGQTFTGRMKFDADAPLSVRQNCANYDTRYGCVIGGRCVMADDKPCEYFESAVVPTLDRQRVRRYKKLVGKKRIKGEGNVRYCECGKPLPKHKHFCSQCSQKRLKASQKRAQQKLKNKMRENA